MDWNIAMKLQENYLTSSISLTYSLKSMTNLEKKMEIYTSTDLAQPFQMQETHHEVT